MCGIAGILDTDRAPVPRELVQAMADALAHRGPDGRDAAVWGPVGFGHARLAIIDLATGQQPMSNEDGQVWITYNGELYNFRELRKELEPLGHRFRTHSDTETIIHAYEQWGEGCVERFRGMFAFGIADLKARCLFLARDHLGIKPLYYLTGRNFFAFASELQALRRVPGTAWTLDLEAVDQYLRLQYIPAPKSVYKEVRKLPPAHRITVDFDGRSEGPREYWRLAFEPEGGLTEAEWIERVDDTLRDSVRAHLVSDVPFGAFLSGGVDSSLVVAYMSELLDRPVRTFTIGFDENEYNEMPYAEDAARRRGAVHHVEIVRPQALDILPKLVQHYGEPFGDSSAIPTYYVSRMARQFVPMVLSGDGGDESFAGYDSYRAWMNSLRTCPPVPPPRSAWRAWLRPMARRMAPWRYPDAARRSTLEDWLICIQNISPSDLRCLWRREYERLCPAPLETFEREYRRARRFSACSRVQYMDIKTYLPFSILAKVDIASMMHGLEVRTPLVDVRVVEMAARIPESLSMARNGDGQWEGKRLLKKVAARYYPAEFLQRRKMGFSVPVEQWFGPGGALRPVIAERLLGKGSMLHDLFQPPAVAYHLAQGRGGPLWLMLFLEEWLRQNRATVSLS